ncbi:MAG TPA: outer membrane protein assembly factor BamD [Thermohalobaculum sp.]|nr:outer membrane protein assembly factor BamD [Thermohalobaculum sp.]
MTTLHLLRLATTLCIVAALAGCSLFSSDEEVTLDETPPGEIFQLGEAQLADGNAIEAAKTFNEIERLYPFSQLAKRAIIMSAFSSYTAGDFGSARASGRRYLDLYPSDKDAPYAQHLIALTYYDNIVDVGRDQATTERALTALREVVSRYPESDFSRDAQLKIDLTLDHLAGKEMEVGRYYLKRGHYTAAINRFRVVSEKYQTTSQTPEALHRMVEANLALGLEREALASAAVLGHNYPGSDWYANSYALLTGRNLLPEGEDRTGFLSRIYRQVIQGKWL